MQNEDSSDLQELVEFPSDMHDLKQRIAVDVLRALIANE
jgi:hypothetical protein